MTDPAITEKLVEAIWDGTISEREAIEFLVAAKRGDKEAIERLMENHGQTDK